VSVDLSVHLLPAAETVDMQSVKYCVALPVWMRWSS